MSDFLVYLVSLYLFKVTNNIFKEVMWRGVYRNCGLLVFKVRISMSDIRVWRYTFQEKVDEIAVSDYLQCTCDTWNPGRHP